MAPLSTPPPTAAPILLKSSKEERRIGRSRNEVLKLMCAHGIVVFESGTEDLSPPTPDHNETWRYTPMAAYRNRLHALMEVWKSCKRDNPKWRGIFKLAAAPKARGLEATPEGLNFNPTDCALQGAALMGAPSLKRMASQPYSAQPHHVQVFNDVARRAVEAAGFEVFDTFAATPGNNSCSSSFAALTRSRIPNDVERGSLFNSLSTSAF